MSVQIVTALIALVVVTVLLRITECDQHLVRLLIRPLQ